MGHAISITLVSISFFISGCAVYPPSEFGKINLPNLSGTSTETNQWKTNVTKANYTVDSNSVKDFEFEEATKKWSSSQLKYKSQIASMCAEEHKEYCTYPMVPHCHGGYCHSHPGGEYPHTHGNDKEFSAQAEDIKPLEP